MAAHTFKKLRPVSGDVQQLQVKIALDRKYIFKDRDAAQGVQCQLKERNIFNIVQ